MVKAGVFAVARSIWSDGDFAQEPFTQREAWLWLIGSAAWQEMRTRGNVGVLQLQRGEFSFATRFLAEKWDWSKSRVNRFILMLENRDMIRDTSRDGSKVYFINKYNDFQVVGLPKRTAKRDGERDSSGTAAGQQRDKEETLKHSNIEKKKEPVADAPVHAVTPRPMVTSTIPDWIDIAAWAGYVEMRRKKRAPLTPRAQELIIKRLQKWRALGHDPTEILDKSTQNSWTDIYEPKPGETNGHLRESRNKNSNFLLGISDGIAEYADKN